MERVPSAEINLQPPQTGTAIIAALKRVIDGENRHWRGIQHSFFEFGKPTHAVIGQESDEQAHQLVVVAPEGRYLDLTKRHGQLAVYPNWVDGTPAAVREKQVEYATCFAAKLQAQLNG